MKKYLILIALINAFSTQAGITTILRRFPKNQVRPIQQKQHYCQTIPVKPNANDIVKKSDSMVQKHGTHLGYFLQHLQFMSFDNLNQMMKYLELIDTYADKKIANIPSPEQFVAFSRQQQEKE